MRRRPVLTGLAVMVAVAIAVLGWFVLQPGPLAFAGGTQVDLAQYRGPSPTGVPAELAGADRITRGRYLATAADCQACHTAPGGRPYAGGRAMVLPFGTLYTPNLTPDAATGIGRWSDRDFLRAVHQGVAKDGTRLYPAFPYASYAMLSDDDVLSIRVYLASLAPVRNVVPAARMRFPFNQRWLMAVWSTMFNREGRFRPVAERSPEWNRGAYLVEAAAHCGECHTPRNLMQAMDQRRKFAGGEADGWHAYNITTDRVSGVGAWSPQELADYLAEGHAGARGAASGPMREAVEVSLSRLAPSDVAAMVAYLRSVPPIRSGALPEMAGPAPAAPSAGPVGNAVGKRLFEGACASCHAWNGEGAILREAQLTGNRAANDVTALNVARIILEGSGSPHAGRPYMPGFADAYSDREIASVANYVTARFGSRQSDIDAPRVARLRAEEAR